MERGEKLVLKHNEKWDVLCQALSVSSRLEKVNEIITAGTNSMSPTMEVNAEGSQTSQSKYCKRLLLQHEQIIQAEYGHQKNIDPVEPRNGRPLLATSDISVQSLCFLAEMEQLKYLVQVVGQDIDQPMQDMLNYLKRIEGQILTDWNLNTGHPLIKYLANLFNLNDAKDRVILSEER